MNIIDQLEKTVTPAVMGNDDSKTVLNRGLATLELAMSVGL